jgi:hypothetical protein
MIMMKKKIPGCRGVMTDATFKGKGENIFLWMLSWFDRSSSRKSKAGDKVQRQGVVQVRCLEVNWLGMQQWGGIQHVGWIIGIVEFYIQRAA